MVGGAATLHCAAFSSTSKDDDNGNDGTRWCLQKAARALAAQKAGTSVAAAAVFLLQDVPRLQQRSQSNAVSGCVGGKAQQLVHMGRCFGAPKSDADGEPLVQPSDFAFTALRQMLVFGGVHHVLSWHLTCQCC